MNAKTMMTAVMMLAALVAGAFGGMAADTFFGDPATNQPVPPRTARTNTAADETDTTADEEDATDDGAADALRSQAAMLQAIRLDLNALAKRMDQLEGDIARTLRQRVDDLEGRLDSVGAGGAPSAVPSAGGNPAAGTSGAALAPDSPEFQEAVERAIEQREAERRERERQQREERMTQMMKQQADTILNRLSEEIAMTDVQKQTIAAVLEQRNTARAEVMRRGMEAREKGEEFDWRGEMESVETGAMESIRLELDATQEATFDQLTAENGLDGLGGWGGGWGGRRGR